MRTPTKSVDWGVGKTILFSLILTTLFFGALEAAVRVWVYVLRDPAERFDTATETFVLIPGSHPRAGARPIQVNSRGFVGPEFDDPPPPGVTRIVTVGDSCTFGDGTAGETYPEQLALRLNNRDKAYRYQIINAGIEGLDTDLALRRLVTRVLPLKPDVITAYLGWNDLMKREPAGQAETGVTRFVAHAIDKLWLVKGMRKLLFFYLRPALNPPATGVASRTGAFREYRPREFEENFRKIIHTARDSGAKIVVMTLPSVVSDDMTLEDLRKANVVFPYYASAYRVGDLVDLIATYNRSIRSIAASENVKVIDLAEELDHRPDRRTLFSDTMHPTQKGRELIADILASHLRRP